MGPGVVAVAEKMEDDDGLYTTEQFNVSPTRGKVGGGMVGMETSLGNISPEEGGAGESGGGVESVEGEDMEW